MNRHFEAIFKFYNQLRQNNSDRIKLRPNVVLDTHLTGSIETLNLFNGNFQDPIHFYATAKYCWELCTLKNSPFDHQCKEIHYHLVNATYYIGEYIETIEQAKLWLNTYGEHTLYENIDLHINMLNRLAKTYRNIGSYQEALKIYRDVLSLCEDNNLFLKKMFILLMIGKIYRYLEQNSLNYYFTLTVYNTLMEAYYYQRLEQADSTQAKYLALCLDELGSIEGKSEESWKDALEHVEKAYEINSKPMSFNVEGQSRNLYRKAQLLLYWTKNICQDEPLKLMNQSLQILTETPTMQKVIENYSGISIRYTQLADMLVQYRIFDEAKKYLDLAQCRNTYLKDYRNMLRTHIVFAKFFSKPSEYQSDEMAQSHFEQAQKIAIKLCQEEKEIECNENLINIYKKLTKNKPNHLELLEPQRNLLKRNQDILKGFQQRAAETRDLFKTKEANKNQQIEIPLEIIWLHAKNQSQLHDLYYHLMKDYDYIIGELSTTVFHSMELIEKINILKEEAEIHRQLSNVLRVRSMSLQYFLHDLKSELSPKIISKRLCNCVERCHDSVSKVIYQKEKEADFINQELQLTQKNLEEISEDLIDLKSRLEKSSQILLNKLREVTYDAHIDYKSYLGNSFCFAIKNILEKYNKLEKWFFLEMKANVKIDKFPQDILNSTISNLLVNAIDVVQKEILEIESGHISTKRLICAYSYFERCGYAKKIIFGVSNLSQDRSTNALLDAMLTLGKTTKKMAQVLV